MKKIVVKISSNLLNPDNKDFIEKLCNEVSILNNKGYKIIIVTSGAVMYGVKSLKFDKKPTNMPMLQSCAAIGQIKLMTMYQNLFGKYDLITAQILVSSDDFRIRSRYLNLRNTVESLLDINAIPIFNENDSINIEELKLGDNDNLSSLITIMMNFKMLILLTDVDGLYDKDPKLFKDAELIKQIDDLNSGYFKMTGGTVSKFSTGGMKSKIEASLKAVNAGVDIFIGNGNKTSLLKIVNNQEYGTYIKSKSNKINARKKWLGLSPTASGSIYIDKGASEALLKNSSLLASGITAVEGNFSKGSLINIITDNKKIAQGLTNYSSKEIDLIKGKKSGEFHKIIENFGYKEVIHKNNLLLIN
ncbi:MAG: glutamate 5-kinase [Spirochaetes bacterium]|nr:glutamate 5-kinase [Spirochaetota bacterium]